MYGIVNYMKNIRSNFRESWLSESPVNIGHFDTFPVLEHDIQERIEEGYPIKRLSEDIFKMEGPQLVFYWVTRENDIALAIELEKKPNCLMVIMLGKNPKYRGSEPHASKLYEVIIQDNQTVVLSSDSHLSEEGFKVWKQLLKDGYHIMVYNAYSNSGYPSETIKSESDLEKFFGTGDNWKFGNFRFIIASNSNLAECRSIFTLQKLYENCGYNLDL